MSTKRTIGLWIPVILYMASIFVFSASQLPSGPPAGWDKLVHVGAYCGLGLLCLRAFHGGLGPLCCGATLAALIMTAGYGAFDEWHQSRVPGRHPSVADWLADVVGAGLALPGALVAVRARVWLSGAGDPR